MPLSSFRMTSSQNQKVSKRSQVDIRARRTSRDSAALSAEVDFYTRSFDSTVAFRGRVEKMKPAGAIPHSMTDVRRLSRKPLVSKCLIRRDSSKLQNCIVFFGSFVRLSPAWSLRSAILVAMVFGAVSAAVLSKNFGNSVFARDEKSPQGEILSQMSSNSLPESKTVLGEKISVSDDRLVDEVSSDLEEIQKAQKENELESKMKTMVSGYPIEEMLPYILEKDRTVAAFLIGIAKKESGWGRRVPLLHEHDCFNYWGYRGKRRLMGTGGHTCFNSPKDAVDTVSRRLEKLIYSEKINTPAKMMVVWKCGYDCSGHSSYDTKKWIQDVDLYFHKLDEE